MYSIMKRLYRTKGATLILVSLVFFPGFSNAYFVESLLHKVQTILPKSDDAKNDVGKKTNNANTESKIDNKPKLQINNKTDKNKQTKTIKEKTTKKEKAVKHTEKKDLVSDDSEKDNKKQNKTENKTHKSNSDNILKDVKSNKNTRSKKYTKEYYLKETEGKIDENKKKLTNIIKSSIPIQTIDKIQITSQYIDKIKSVYLLLEKYKQNKNIAKDIYNLQEHTKNLEILRDSMRDMLIKYILSFSDDSKERYKKEIEIIWEKILQEISFSKELSEKIINSLLLE